MQILPLRSSAIRMAVLILVVAALDVAAACLIAKPLLWCARIPALIPLFTPAVIFTRRPQSKG
jgi:hypothetical protein